MSAQRSITVLVMMAVCLLGLGAQVMAAPMSGAIWTTDSSGGPVDRNIYDAKCNVYLNGGPKQGNAAGLPDGWYHVKVTEPNGMLLGKTLEPVVEVLNGRIVGLNGLCDILFTVSSGFTAKGYDDTTNPGGEYKVWASQDPAFPNDESKTDNFKVKEEGGGGLEDPDEGELIVRKFYDANANASWDAGESEILGWQIGVSNLTTGFDVGTKYTVYDAWLESGSYLVWEYFPIEPNWLPTTPDHTVTIVTDDQVTDVVFGNVCLGAGGGRTLGFWSNKNGQGLIDGDQLYALSVLNLKNATGVDFDPVPLKSYPPSAGQISTGKTVLRSWLLSGNAVSMAYMLSVQLAAMQLNVLNGFVNPDALIFAPGTMSANPLGFATVQAVMNEANDSLGAYGETPAGSAARAIQEAIKNALDDANNNLTFVQSAPCPFTFAD